MTDRSLAYKLFWKQLERLAKTTYSFSPRTGPCDTTLATGFDSDLRSVDTLRSSRAPSCDLASQGSSLCSSGNLTASP